MEHDGVYRPEGSNREVREAWLHARAAMANAHQAGVSATVVGCGGLGGYVIEELARLGVGRIVAVDVVDSVAVRQELADAGGALKIPVVHGAIA